MPRPRDMQIVPLLLAVALMMVMLASQAAEAQRTRQILTACQDMKGFFAVADTAIGVAAGGSIPFADASTAYTNCLKNPQCVGYTLYKDQKHVGAMLGYVTSWDTSSPRTCSYIKKKPCPMRTAPAGFSAYPYQAWVTGAGSTVDTKSSAEAAAAYCASETTCKGFTGDGQYILGSISGRTAVNESVCVYTKDVCPPKFGYMALQDRTTATITASIGAARGNAGSAAAAESFCKLDYRCQAFATDGTFSLGGVKTAVRTGICTYVKNPCAPMRGFVAVNDATFTDNAAAGISGVQMSASCLDDVYTACLSDASCKGFNSRRFTWNYLPSGADKFTTYMSNAPGACTYVKIEVYETP